MTMLSHLTVLLVFCEAAAVVLADRKLLVVTVATERNDGYDRFKRSTDLYDLEVVALGMGEEWQGGDMAYPGGGWKVNLLKAEMEKRKDDDVTILFTDSYDVIFTAGKESILAQYEKMDAGLLFGAENFCWPDSSLKSSYPEVKKAEMRFLNSGGFIGPADKVHAMLEAGGDINNKDDDQLFYTRIYLNKELRRRFNMKLDHRAQLFQNLNGEQENVELRFAGNSPFIQNLKYETVPMILHGNGPSKLLLNTLGNYVAGSWEKESGCLDCWRDTITFSNLPETPKVVLAIFIEKPTPFMMEFWEKLDALDYPKDSIDVFVHNNVEFHAGMVADWSSSTGSQEFNSVTVVPHTDKLKEWHARTKAVEQCVAVKCDYLFVVDSEVHLDNPLALQLLIEQNRQVVAPMLIRPYSAWSNFWGSLSSDGFYARSVDYMEIVNNNRRGLWNVPFISSCYLISGSLIHNEATRPKYIKDMLDADMAFAADIRSKNVFLYVSNRVNFGHLVNNENYPTTHLNNELWEMERNRYDWEARYIHPNYTQTKDQEEPHLMPCPDVYWFPIFSERFCDEFVSEAEHFGKWSDGSNSDTRLQGGYEAVPTRDIHMNQIGYDDEWLYILDFYIRPLQEKVFIGYFHQPPRSLMNFIVRYRPEEQPNLRPHHDSSTYTINVALNKPGIDYQGGGCRFLRYDCKVTDSKKGWILMHPGRLTHYHEGLTTTAGTRYIMISFVDP